MKNLIAIISIISFVFVNSTLSAQDKVITEVKNRVLSKSDPVTVVMKDGSIYVGEIIIETDTQLEIKSSGTNIIVYKKDTKSISRKSDFYAQATRIHSSKYFHSNTAIPIEAGEVSLQNILVLYNKANLGLTKHLSISAGFEIMSLVSLDPIIHIAPMLSFGVSDNVHFGVGLKAAGFLTDTYLTSFGKLTIGNTENNFTISAGINLNTPEYYDIDQSFAPIEFSGMMKCTDRVSIISENRIWSLQSHDLLTEWVGPKPMYLGIHGVRINHRRSAFDLGFMAIHSFERDLNLLEFFSAVPHLSYSYAFSLNSKRK